MPSTTLPPELVEDTPRQFYNRQTVINQVTVSYGEHGADNRPVAHAEDLDSIEAHGPSSRVIATELDDTSSTQAQALADTVLARCKDPRVGVDLTVHLNQASLDLAPAAAPPAVWIAVATLIGGPTVQFTTTDLLGVTRTWNREQQQITWTPAGWQVDMTLLEAVEPEGASS